MTHFSQSPFDVISARAAQSSGVKSKTSRFEQKEWTSKSCEDHASRFSLPSKIKLFDIQRAIMIRFVNFYTCGTVPAGHSTRGIIIDMASLLSSPEATSAEELYWDPKWFEDVAEGVPVHSSAKIRARGNQERIDPQPETLTVSTEPAALPKISTGLETIPPGAAPNFGTGGETSNLEAPTQIIKQYTSKDLKEFVAACKEVIDDSPADQTPGDAFYVLRSLLNYLALTFLRFTVKDEAQMAQAFSKTQYAGNIANLIFSDTSVYYSPPCNAALTKARLAINKKNKDTSSFIAKLVVTWLKASIESEEIVAAIIAASVLTHTAHNGMGILEMIAQITDHYETSWLELADLTCTARTIKSWDIISSFFVTHLPNNNPDQTYPWARVIHDGYFTEFKTAKHASLAAILAPSLAACQEDQGIYTANWAIKRKATVDDLKPLGEAVLAELAGTLSRLEGMTEKSRKVIERAKGLQISAKPTKTIPVRNLDDF